MGLQDRRVTLNFLWEGIKMIGVEFLVLTFFAAMALIGIGYLSREGEIEALKDEIEVLKRATIK